MKVRLTTQLLPPGERKAAAAAAAVVADGAIAGGEWDWEQNSYWTVFFLPFFFLSLSLSLSLSEWEVVSSFSLFFLLFFFVFSRREGMGELRCPDLPCQYNKGC